VTFGDPTRSYVNVVGNTQFRLRLKKTDNVNGADDLLWFFSGDALQADRPQLLIEYVVP
jgi:hypothetical protein